MIVKHQITSKSVNMIQNSYKKQNFGSYCIVSSLQNDSKLSWLAKFAKMKKMFVLKQEGLLLRYHIILSRIIPWIQDQIH